MKGFPFKTIIIWMVVAFAAMALYHYLSQPDPKTQGEVVRTELISAYNNALDGIGENQLSTINLESMAKSGNVKEVYYLTDEKTIYAFAFTTSAPSNTVASPAAVRHNYTIAISSSAEASHLINSLITKGVHVNTVMIPPEKPSGIPGWLIAVMVILAIIIIMNIIAARRQGGGAGGAAAFGKSKAKMQKEGEVNVTFDDVAGCDEAKEDVEETVLFLKDPAQFHDLGGKMPTGLLMAGPPGTGKTLLAKAIAGEAGVPFFTISGSDFVEMFVGVGASRVRDLFTEAKKHAPCIIFIDEIDAVGRQRGAGVGGGNDEREQTLNQLLVEMDGFEGNEGIVVIAATNRPDVLDPALLRPGRFDRQITVSVPDINGREQILKVHMRNIKLAEDADTIAPTIARGTPGFSGADLANLANEAALFASRQKKSAVDLHDFEKAKDKIMMGAERKSMKMSEDERRMTAYHEAGHAVVGEMLRSKGHDPAYKVSIMPRGRALGVTMFLPEQDRFSHSKELLQSMISGLYGGRLAEEIIFGKEKVSTGASNDIERATSIAEKMVKEWGLVPGKDNEGKRDTAPRRYTQEDAANPFLGKQAGNQKPVSGQTVHELDERIETVLNNNYQVARSILEEHEDKLHAMADALLKYETIDADMIGEIVSGKKFTELSTPKWWTKEDEAAYQAKIK
jgi:cell division protease FtsH